MKFTRMLLLTALAASVSAGMASAATAPHYLITNNDQSQGNTATFYSISGGSLIPTKLVSTGGLGNDGIGNVSTKRVSVLRNSSQSCAFVSNADTGDITGISIATLTVTGNFTGNPGDSGSVAGLGIVNNGSYLFANYTASHELGAFQIDAGCTLTFLGETATTGAGNGPMLDMAADQNILVASYQDGSIQSFNVANGVPVSNGDLHFSNGNAQGYAPEGVDLTADGHFAIFGDSGITPAVEVSDVSSGKLTPTIVYKNLGSGSGVSSIRLSPNEGLIYMGEFSAQQVAAAFFDKSSGIVTPGCSLAVSGASDVAGLMTGSPSGTGGVLYAAEIENLIGIFRITATAGSCSFTESPKSPVVDRNTVTLESIGVFPPRAF